MRVAVWSTILLILVFATSITSIACFDPSDNYSLEVVLSKPGIKYDLSILDKIQGVVRIGKDYLYIWRSHISPSDIIVVVSLQPLSLKTNAEKYISIRIEGKTIVVNKTINMYYLKTEAAREISIEEIKNVLKEYNWSMNAYSSDNIIKALLLKNTNNTTITVSMIVSYINGKTLFSLTFRLEQSVDNDIVLKNLEEALKKITNNMEVDFTKKTITEQEIRPSPNITEELLKEALEYELKWLISLRVIDGLTSNDIKNILSSIKEGMAGWNSRLVYFNNKWYPYYEVVKEIPGGALVKTSSGCGWNYPLELLPLTPPQAGINNSTVVSPIETTSTTVTQTPYTTQTIPNTTSVSTLYTPTTTHETVTEAVGEGSIGDKNTSSSIQIGGNTNASVNKIIITVTIVIVALVILLGYISMRRK